MRYYVHHGDNCPDDCLCYCSEDDILEIFENSIPNIQERLAALAKNEVFRDDLITGSTFEFKEER